MSILMTRAHLCDYGPVSITIHAFNLFSHTPTENVKINDTNVKCASSHILCQHWITLCCKKRMEKVQQFFLWLTLKVILWSKTFKNLSGTNPINKWKYFRYNAVYLGAQRETFLLSNQIHATKHKANIVPQLGWGRKTHLKYTEQKLIMMTQSHNKSNTFI